jgi:thermopsin
MGMNKSAENIKMSEKTKSNNNNKILALSIIVIIALSALALAIPATSAFAIKPGTASTSRSNLSIADLARIGPRSALPSRALTEVNVQGMNPGCGSAPCPMGIVDYGITPSLGTYSYKTNINEGFVDIAALAIGTANGGGCLDPNALAGVCFTIQSNWIAQSFVAGNNIKGEYWTQNVPEIAFDGSCSSPCVSKEYSVTWLDNIWNFSASSIGVACGSSHQTGCMEGMTGNLAKACSAYSTGGSFYYCVGPTIYGLVPPFTIWTWTDVGPGSGAFGVCPSSSTVSCVNFFGEIVVNAVPIFGEYYDGVSFSHASTTIKPSYLVSGTGCPGYCLPWDGELVAGGPGGGSSNAVYLLGTWQQLHSNNGVKVTSIKHAWSSGADTAETISDLYMWGFFGLRDSATSGFANDNPQTSLW